MCPPQLSSDEKVMRGQCARVLEVKFTFIQIDGLTCPQSGGGERTLPLESGLLNLELSDFTV